MTEPQYPQHEKLAEVKDESQTIGYFLDWLQSKAVIAAYEDGVEVFVNGSVEESDDPLLVPHARYSGGDIAIQKVLADYYGIDYDALMAEKEAMYQSLRAETEGRQG